MTNTNTNLSVLFTITVNGSESDAWHVFKRLRDGAETSYISAHTGKWWHDNHVTALQHEDGMKIEGSFAVAHKLVLRRVDRGFEIIQLA